MSDHMLHIHACPDASRGDCLLRSRTLYVRRGRSSERLPADGAAAERKATERHGAAHAVRIRFSDRTAAASPHYSSAHSNLHPIPITCHVTLQVAKLLSMRAFCKRCWMAPGTALRAGTDSGKAAASGDVPGGIHPDGAAPDDGDEEDRASGGGDGQLRWALQAHDLRSLGPQTQRETTNR